MRYHTSLPVAVATACTLSLLAACGGNASLDGKQDAPADAGSADKGTFTVGLLNPVTGPFAALGTDFNAGFDLYLESKGGALSGYKINTPREDEGTDAAQGTTKARQLVEKKKADMVIGLVNSAIAYAVAPYLEKQDVPLLIGVAGADGLTRTKDGNTFRISYTSSQDTMPLGTYACEELGHKKATLIGLDYSFGWEAAGGFARTYEDAGCSVVQEIYSPLNTQDWAPILNQVDKSADAVFAVTPGGDGIRLLKAADGFGLKAPLLVHGSTVDETILPTQGDTALDVISSLHYSPQIATPENEAFVKAFTEAEDKSPNQYAEDGWAAAQVLEQALSQIDKDPTPAKIKAALAKVKVNAPRGPLSFDEYGQAVYNVYIRKVEKKDGKPVNAVVETIENVGQFAGYDAEEYLDFRPYEKLKNSWAK